MVKYLLEIVFYFFPSSLPLLKTLVEAVRGEWPEPTALRFQEETCLEGYRVPWCQGYSSQTSENTERQISWRLLLGRNSGNWGFSQSKEFGINHKPGIQSGLIWLLLVVGVWASHISVLFHLLGIYSYLFLSEKTELGTILPGRKFLPGPGKAKSEKETLLGEGAEVRGQGRRRASPTNERWRSDCSWAGQAQGL